MIKLNDKDIKTIEELKKTIKNKNVYEVYEYKKDFKGNYDFTTLSLYYTNLKEAKKTLNHCINYNTDKNYDFTLIKLEDFEIVEILENF